MPNDETFNSILTGCDVIQAFLPGPFVCNLLNAADNLTIKYAVAMTITSKFESKFLFPRVIFPCLPMFTGFAWPTYLPTYPLWCDNRLSTLEGICALLSLNSQTIFTMQSVKCLGIIIPQCVLWSLHTVDASCRHINQGLMPFALHP